MTTLFNNSGADFSDDRKYRYKLWRIWNYELPYAMVIGLNPSTANEDTNDPTIGIVSRMLVKLGYGGFFMMNLFTIISSDPKILRNQTGWSNWLRDKDILVDVSKKCQDVIFAWGNFKEAESRSSLCEREFPNAKCFGFNKNGSPAHPLAMMYNGTQKNPQLVKFK